MVVLFDKIPPPRQHRAQTNRRFETADAMNLPFAGASFDVAVCGLGLNYIPDPARGLEEFCRVLSPGGTVAAYLWDYAKGARFLREFWDAAIALDAGATDADQARRFPICTPEGLRGVFEQAGVAEMTPP